MKEQDLQEAEYNFPYHYISEFKDGFRQCLRDDWSIHYVSTIEFLLSRLSKIHWHSLIDIGCGDGRMSREIKLMFTNRYVSGIDFSKHAIQLAKAMNQDLPSIVFEERDITIDNSKTKYDVAILMEVLEHIPPESSADFIAAVHAQLSKGGTLLLTVPHSNKPVEYKHFMHFDSVRLKAILQNNFEIIEIIPFERRSILTRILNLLIGNSFYLINNKTLLNFFYQFYKKYLFSCSNENQCQRLYVMAKAL